MIQAYRKLNVWAKSMDLVDEVYRLTHLFPTDEKYGLTSQIRRAAVSIPSNIAEGSLRNGKKEFLQFLSIAYASLAELETQIEIAKRQSYITASHMNVVFQLTAEVGKMLNGLVSSLNSKLPTTNRQLTEA